ncbi:MAG TPA: hypothetical protein PKY78_08815 [Candidatus Omnitrophota bacterium]|mgnify:CR=1 FL=1|nr:hypothetical protein [Candidatus Omnitrophota bacterium]HPS21071.1 hypothetical protein [Candidatus Omnitrophota bacterium]
METVKNFVIGLVAVIVSLCIFFVVALVWPLILGISSIILALVAGVFFIVLIFFIIVLIGKTIRALFSHRHYM